jgi:hypothetical protein
MKNVDTGVYGGLGTSLKRTQLEGRGNGFLGGKEVPISFAKPSIPKYKDSFFYLKTSFAHHNINYLTAIKGYVTRQMRIIYSSSRAGGIGALGWR